MIRLLGFIVGIFIARYFPQLLPLMGFILVVSVIGHLITIHYSQKIGHPN